LIADHTAVRRKLRVIPSFAGRSFGKPRIPWGFFYDTEFISFTLIITCIVSAKLLPAFKDAEGVFA